MKAHERLAWAIQHHGPGDRTPRAFQRAVRHHAGRTASSYYAITRYLEGGRLIPAALCHAAAQVMPVRAEWLEHGEEPRLQEDAPATRDEPKAEGGEASVGPPAQAEIGSDVSEAGADEGEGPAGPEARGDASAGSPPADSPFADIYPVVMATGEEPPADHLEILDPKYPRNGLTRRDWSILYGIVSGGEDVAAAAARVGLSEDRVRAICEEQAELVRNVSGINA